MKSCASLRAFWSPPRAEPGCVHIHLYQSIREPMVFFIHSEWVDEEAFNRHPEFPHMRRFLSVIDDGITEPLVAARTREIG